MWFERFVIIVTSIYRDYVPSSWSTYYRPTIWEIGFYMGTFGLFFTCYFLFSKFFPVIAIAEIKHILKKAGLLVFSFVFLLGGAMTQAQESAGTPAAKAAFEHCGRA